MNKGSLAALLLLLIGGVSAAVYKWVDESGMVHYGDSPPAESDVQSVAVPKGPSQEEVERARQQMQEKIDQYEKFSRDASSSKSNDKLSRETKTRAVSPDNVACFTPLSNLVQGPSAGTFTPITPTSLTKMQKKSLHNLLRKADAYWQGTISNLQCRGSPSEPKSKITVYEAKTTADWNVRKSRLTIETDRTGKESGVNKQLITRFEVGDALYFNDDKPAIFIALDGNKVELLTLNQNRVSFLIKRRIPAAKGTRRPRGEVRHLEISGRTLKLIELYYLNDMLMESRTWILGR